MNDALSPLRSIRPILAISAAATLLLGACGTVGIEGTAGPPLPAPTLHVGDRWTYHGEQGFRVKIAWDETHEITSIAPDGITVQVTTTGTGASVRTEKWRAPGVVLIGAVLEDETQRFDPALIRYQYPLTTGSSWQQRIRNLDKPPGPYGPLLRTITVGGYQNVTTPAGSFDAMMLRVVMTLDDETAFRWPTECNGIIWYAAAAAAAVQSQIRCQSREKGDDQMASQPGPNPELRLTSFRRAP